MSTTWKSRWELPVIKQLDIRFDIDRLREELKLFSTNKVWDGLGYDDCFEYVKQIIKSKDKHYRIVDIHISHD